MRFNELKGWHRVGAVVGLCLLSHFFLTFIFAGAGFGGIWAFYALPSVVFFLMFASFAVKTIAKPADTKWLVGQPTYWFAILLGALLSGCALGFHWPTVEQLSATTKLKTVSELQGFPESIEFVNGVVAFIPSPVTNTTLGILGSHQQEFKSRSTGSGNIPETCFLAVGLGDVGATEAPVGGFSMTVGCEALGRCEDESVVAACLAQLQKDCAPCNPKGAIPVSQLPWNFQLEQGFPSEAIEDFKRKNQISVRGFTHVQFHGFDGIVKDSERVMIGCAVSGVFLTAILSFFYAVRARSKVMAAEQNKTRSEIEAENAGQAKIEVTTVPGMGYLD